MGTEDLTVVATPEEATPQGKTYEENPYGIYDYLKEHTAFLVACVSALVAVISFLLNYAASLYTGAYLRYWMIDTVYAKENNTELVYMILFTLLYTGVMIITHKVMSGTANVFGFYNRILSALKWYYKEAKSNTCAIKRKTKELVRTNKRLAKKLPKTESDQLFKENERLQQEAETLEKSLKEIGSMKCACGLWLFLNVCGSALIMFGIIFVVVGFMTASRGDYRAIGPAVLAGIVVLFDLLIYFFPAYRSSRIKKKNYKEISLSQLKEEMQHADNHRFPIVAVARTKAKDLLTNERIKQIVIIALMMIITTVGFCSSAGKSDAAHVEQFPIYTDETGTYAVVYNNGDTLVLKAAHIEDTQIEINARQQKVVSAADATYEICTFETVIVTGKDGE